MAHHFLKAALLVAQFHCKLTVKCTDNERNIWRSNKLHVARYPTQILLVIVLSFSTRFQLEANITQEMAQQMKKFVLGISDVEIKYRVASQMGFRDVIESLLNGPELPYLKDTVWQSGFNRHHNYLQWEPHITCINNYVLFYVSQDSCL